MKDKRVSVVIPFYGDPVDVKPLLGQILHQDKKSQVEIIISDDCSPIPFPETRGVKVVRRAGNGGFGAAVNSGASLANGEWIFILNSDLSISSDFVDTALAKAEELGDVLFSPQVIGHDGNHQWVGRKFPTAFQWAWEWFTPAARYRSTNVWHRLVGHDLHCATGEVVHTDWVMGACMILRADTFHKVGGFDERFYMNSEEVDLQRRLANIGVPRVFCGDIVVTHEGGGSSGNNIQRRQWVLNSRFIYSSKWGENKYLAKILRGVTALNYVFNRVREKFNPAVSALDIRNSELELIRNGRTQQ